MAQAKQLPNVSSEPVFYWSSTGPYNGAELLTLFCRNCGSLGDTAVERPLLSVLRDTLGDANGENDRLMYSWLLGSPHIGTGRRLLSAVPFFFWSLGHSSGHLNSGDLHPQLNLTAPQYLTMHRMSARLVQWAALDPLDSWARTSTRYFQANQADNERFGLELALSYLRNAPVADTTGGSEKPGLTEVQRSTLIARLQLQKDLMGGLVDTQHATRFGDESSWTEERMRSRNWEMLRLLAEKTGLYFEPLTIGSAQEQYAMLLYAPEVRQPAAGFRTGPIYKLLNIRDPYTDKRIAAWTGIRLTRTLDASGRMLTNGEPGQSVAMIPLALYSLNYANLPLLLIDFRDRLHVKRHEMTERSIAQLTSGIAGLSRLGNWYFYAGSMAYNVVASRHGTAMRQAERLDCYAQFRAHLALDRELPEALRAELARRSAPIAVNPLDVADPRSEAIAEERYQMLMAQMEDGSPLMQRLRQDRRAEMAVFGEPLKVRVRQDLFHLVTLGRYTKRAPDNQLSLAELDRERRFALQLYLLDHYTANGTPEIAYDSLRIQNSLREMRELLGSVHAPLLQANALRTVTRIEQLTKDSVIVADCRDTLVALGAQRSQPATETAAIPPAIVTGSSR